MRRSENFYQLFFSLLKSSLLKVFRCDLFLRILGMHTERKTGLQPRLVLLFVRGSRGKETSVLPRAAFSWFLALDPGVRGCSLLWQHSPSLMRGHIFSVKSCGLAFSIRSHGAASIPVPQTECHILAVLVSEIGYKLTD